MNLAPVILFVYNRPSHTLKTLEALEKNDLANNSVLYIFADAAKESASSETIKNVKETREIIKSKQWCKEVIIVERPQNFGLAKSIIEGVTEVISEFEKVIVLEDDLVTSPYFLKFMNEALLRLEKENTVACISAYIYPINNLPDLFFIKGADCWGWATWKHSWELFEPNGKKLLKELDAKGLTNSFDFNNSYPYTQMLKDQIDKKNDSWAIRWYASCFLKNKLCLYPGISLVENIGLDGSGIHSGATNNFNTAISTNPIHVTNIATEENNDARIEIQAYFTSIKEQTQPTQNILSKFYQRLVPETVREKIYDIRHPKTKSRYGWFGNYKKWEDAETECSGYDNHNILQKVKISILKVKSGEAKYERDSVLFNEIEHNQSLLNAFDKSIEDNLLHITDFGGSLGSSYFQNRSLLPDTLDLKWSVVEQKHFVDCGKNDIAENKLFFFDTIDDVLKHQKNHVLLLSSVLPYFKEPYALIDKLIKYRFKYIIIDRTAFIEGNMERITKQIVPPSIYEASYPAWFFNEEKFMKVFSDQYELIDSFESTIDPSEYLEDNVKSYRKGFYFKLKNI